MTRRIAVLTAGVVLLVLFGVLGTTLPVPYVAQVPGPDVQHPRRHRRRRRSSRVEGREPNDVERQPEPDHGRRQPRRAQPGPGGARLVRRRGQPSSPRSRSTRRTAPRRRPGRPTGEAFLTSEQAAESAALGHLGYPVKVVVQERRRRTRPSEGALEEGDAIDAVDGAPDARRRHASTPSSPAIPGGHDGDRRPTPGSASPGTRDGHHRRPPTDRRRVAARRQRPRAAVGARSTSTSRSRTSAARRPA